MLREIAPHETLGRIDALDWQELHSPTRIDDIQIKLKDGVRVSRERVQRRALDAQLWGSMSSVQQNAAEQIAAGFRLITAGLSPRCQTFLKSYGRSDAQREILVLSSYRDWSKQCLLNKLNVDMVLDILVSGASLHTTDHRFRKRKGTAKHNLLECLNIFVKQKRWLSN